MGYEFNIGGFYAVSNENGDFFGKLPNRYFFNFKIPFFLVVKDIQNELLNAVYHEFCQIQAFLDMSRAVSVEACLYEVQTGLHSSQTSL